VNTLKEIYFQIIPLLGRRFLTGYPCIYTVTIFYLQLVNAHYKHYVVMLINMHEIPDQTSLE